MTDASTPPYDDPVGEAERPTGDHLTVRELLEQPAMELATMLAGAKGLDTPIRRLNVMTVPEIVRWVEQGEFLLSTGFPLRAHGDPAALVRDLSDTGLAGLGIKFDSYLAEFDEHVLAVADELGFPIVAIPIDTRFDDILSQAFETIINRQAAELSRSHRLHHTFLGLTFSGGGIESLVHELAGLLHSEAAAIVDSSGAVLAHAGDLAALGRLAGTSTTEQTVVDPGLLEEGWHTRDGSTWVVAAMAAASVTHGHVIVMGAEGKLGPHALTAAEQAAIVGTLEMMRAQAVRAVSGRFASNLLHELMTGDDLEGVTERAAALDWVLDRDVVVIAALPESARPVSTPGTERPQLREQLASERWALACRRIDPHAALGVLGAHLVAVLGGNVELHKVVTSLHAEMSQSTRRRLSLGVSRRHPGPSGIRTAYQEALRAMRLGQRVNGPYSITHYDELGLFRLLAQLDEAELDAFVADTLGPVLALPGPERSDLLKTLDVLLANHLHIARTAREVHFHYNTLRYRLTKLEKLLGQFGSDAATARRIGVALEILRMRGGLPL
ncbi:MAG TPA: PucR family transcriptional regulator ligand-binding domain-containing protein [Marmoricola sp.]|nr:PucR family transcriptional regulator ligand-binding domain-containing protein [Marmoricola sp.]